MTNQLESLQGALPPTISAGWNDPPELSSAPASASTISHLKQMRTRPVHPSINAPNTAPHCWNYSTHNTWTTTTNNVAYNSGQLNGIDQSNYIHYSQNNTPNYLDGYGNVPRYN